MKDPQTIFGYIQCLSILEEKNYHLYRAMADKVDLPLASGFLCCIAQDSLKHSKLLKSLDCADVSEKKIKACEKKLRKILRIIDNFYIEIQARERIIASDFPRIADNFAILACLFSQEYSMLAKVATLQPLVKVVNEVYNINFEVIQQIFVNMLAEENQHRTLLSTVNNILRENISEATEHAPSVRFQNPDRWSQTLPSTTYS